MTHLYNYEYFKFKTVTLCEAAASLCTSQTYKKQLNQLNTVW